MNRAAVLPSLVLLLSLPPSPAGADACAEGFAAAAGPPAHNPPPARDRESRRVRREWNRMDRDPRTFDSIALSEARERVIGSPWDFSDEARDARIFRAEEALGRPLTRRRERHAIDEAYLTPRGEAGFDGSPAVVGNHTQEQVTGQTRRLREAGFDSAEARRIIESGAVGARRTADEDEAVEFTDADRIRRAEKEVRGPLTDRQERAVLDAHGVGAGEAGFDGSPAVVGNYTPDQIRRRTWILREAGFTPLQVKSLMRDGVVGRVPSMAARGAAGSTDADRIALAEEIVATELPFVIPARINLAEEVVGRPLTWRQRRAIRKANDQGRWSPGLDGSPATIGNHTQYQITMQMRDLRRAGFDFAEIGGMMEAGVVGRVRRAEDGTADITLTATERVARAESIGIPLTDLQRRAVIDSSGDAPRIAQAEETLLEEKANHREMLEEMAFAGYWVVWGLVFLGLTL